jgi:hypothetical protein
MHTERHLLFFLISLTYPVYASDKKRRFYQRLEPIHSRYRLFLLYPLQYILTLPVYYSPVYYSPVYYSPVYYSPVYYSPVYYSPVYYSPVSMFRFSGPSSTDERSQPAPTYSTQLNCLSSRLVPHLTEGWYIPK